MKPQKKMSKKKKIIIALLIIFSPIELFILLVIFLNIYYPISEYFDHQKFITLDTESKKIFNQLSTISPNEDKWEYKTGCDNELSGPWPTGRYHCVTVSILEKTVNSATEAKALHEKYYAIVESSSKLTSEGGLSNPSIYNGTFVVDDSGKFYRQKDTNARCVYEFITSQATKGMDYHMYDDGALIIGAGKVTIALQCLATGERSWYPTIKSTSTVPADFSAMPDDGEAEFFRLF